MGVYLYTFRAQTVNLNPVGEAEGMRLTPKIYQANVMKFLCRMSALEEGWNESRFSRIQRAAHAKRWEGVPLPKLVTYGEPKKGTGVMLVESMETATEWHHAAWFDCNKGREYGVLGDRQKGGAWDCIVTYDPKSAAAEDKLSALLPEVGDTGSQAAWEHVREGLFTLQREHADERKRRLEAYGGFVVDGGWTEVVT